MRLSLYLILIQVITKYGKFSNSSPLNFLFPNQHTNTRQPTVSDIRPQLIFITRFQRLFTVEHRWEHKVPWKDQRSSQRFRSYSSLVFLFRYSSSIEHVTLNMLSESTVLPRLLASVLAANQSTEVSEARRKSVVTTWDVDPSNASMKASSLVTSNHWAPIEGNTRANRNVWSYSCQRQCVLVHSCSVERTEKWRIKSFRFELLRQRIPVHSVHKQRQSVYRRYECSLFLLLVWLMGQRRETLTFSQSRTEIYN